MKKRATDLDSNLKHVTFSTFHAKGLSLLKQFNILRKFKIVDDRTTYSLISNILRK